MLRIHVSIDAVEKRACFIELIEILYEFWVFFFKQNAIFSIWFLSIDDFEFPNQVDSESLFYFVSMMREYLFFLQKEIKKIKKNHGKLKSTSTSSIFAAISRQTKTVFLENRKQTILV